MISDDPVFSFFSLPILLKLLSIYHQHGVGRPAKSLALIRRARKSVAGTGQRTGRIIKELPPRK